MGKPFYHATVALCFHIEICNLDRTTFTFIHVATSLYKKKYFSQKDWVARFYHHQRNPYVMYPATCVLCIFKWSNSSIAIICTANLLSLNLELLIHFLTYTFYFSCLCLWFSHMRLTCFCLLHVHVHVVVYFCCCFVTSSRHESLPIDLTHMTS